MAGRSSEAMRAAKALKTASKEKSVREKLGDALADQYELLLKVMQEAMQARKKVRIEEPCPKCGCNHFRFVEVADIATQLRVAEFWTVQGFGRPGEDKAQASAPNFVVHRHVVEPPAEGETGTAGPPRAEIEDRDLSALIARAAASAPESADRNGAES